MPLLVSDAHVVLCRASLFSADWLPLPRLVSPRLTLAPGCCWVIKEEAASAPCSPPRQQLIKSHFKAQKYSLSLTHTYRVNNKFATQGLFLSLVCVWYWLSEQQCHVCLNDLFNFSLLFLNFKSDYFPTDGDSDDDEGLEDLSDMSGDDDDDAASDAEEDSGQCFHAVYDVQYSRFR